MKLLTLAKTETSNTKVHINYANVFAIYRGDDDPYTTIMASDGYRISVLEPLDDVVAGLDNT